MSMSNKFMKTNLNAVIEIFKRNEIIDLTLVENVCNILFKNKLHITIDEIENELSKMRGLKFNRKQLFEITDILIKYGFIKKIIFDNDETARFEPFYSDKHHDHFVCTCCKKIIEFYNEEFENMQKRISDSIGLTLSHKLELYGLCNECLGVKAKEKVMPLTHAENGRQVKIIRIDAGKNFTSRLAQLGFLPDGILNIISNTGCGAVIVEIKNARIALGYGESSKIIVSYLT